MIPFDKSAHFNKSGRCTNKSRALMKCTALACFVTIATAQVDVAGTAQTSAQADAGAQEAVYRRDWDKDSRPHTAVCLARCPLHTPCLNKHTGACAPKIYAPGYEPSFVQNHRQLSSDTVSDTVGGCPEGTKDSNDLQVSKQWPFWTGFGLLFVPAAFFLCLCSADLISEDFSSANPVELSVALKTFLAGFVCLVASLAYLTMATNHGYIERCCDGRSFYYARYIDWAITTPIMLWELTTLAGEVHEKAFDAEFYLLIFVDILMVIAGLIGSLVCADEKWAFFGFSMLCFLPILYILCDWASEEPIDREGEIRVYKYAMNITVCTWFFYPVVWICAEGTDILSANGEAIAYTCLDVIAKSLFGYVIVSSMIKKHVPGGQSGSFL